MSAEGQQNQKQGVTARHNKDCTLLVPGLLNVLPDSNEIGELPRREFKELELFLARAISNKQDYLSCESVLFNLFDIPLSEENDLPVAPLTYLGDTGVSVTSWCLRADPVHLLPDRDELVLSGPESLLLSMSESEHLASELNRLFAEDGWRIEVANTTRWYLHLQDNPQIRTRSLLQVNGRSIGRFLPEGPQAKQWHRLMNEVQMILHGSEVNRNRQVNGQRTVSSLWFWGAGQLPEHSHSRWAHVWTDEITSKGLAKLTQTPCSSLPKNAHDWLSNATAPGEHLLLYPELSQQANSTDIEQWQKALLWFQQEWLSPLLTALKKKEIESFTINSCDGQSFRLTAGKLKRWWLRPKALRHFLRHDPEHALSGSRKYPAD